MTDDAEPFDALREDFVDAGLRFAFTPPTPGPSAAAGPSARPENPRAPDERYELRGEIARGGVGVVFRGRDADLGRDVAVKILLERHLARSRIVERFLEEARIAGTLQHPGIVPIYDFGVLRDGRPFFTMRLVEGRTLAELLRARPSAESDRHRFLLIFERVCQAVAYAHARGVVHLDLKPANVMVGSFGEVQVMDWGLSRVLAADDFAAAGSVMGTPGYLSPEAARGDVRALDERADVFGLGAILCEILTGRPPIPSESADEAFRSAAAGELSAARARLRHGVDDAALVELASRCLEATPDARPRSAGEVAAAVSAHLGSLEERAQAARVLAAETRVKAENAARARRLTVALASSLLLTFAVAGAAGWWLDRERRDRLDSTAAGVNLALADAARFEGEARSGGQSSLATWDQAAASVERARSLLRAGESSPALASRVEEAATTILDAQTKAHERARQIDLDAAMVARLENVRAPEGSDFDPGDNERLDAEFAAAFREYGIDVDALPSDVAALAVAKSRIALALVVTLDDWADRRLHVKSTHWSRDDGLRLLEIADRADPDERRKSLRSCLRSDDAESLRKLAADGELASWPKETLVLLGRQLHRSGHTDRGLEVLQLAQELHPDDFRINFDLGCLLDRAAPGRKPDAIRCFSMARAARPENVEALHRLGREYFGPGEYERGLRLFLEATARRPNDGHLLAHLGGLQVETTGAESALPTLREAVRLEPEDSYAWFHLGRALYSLSRWDESEAANLEAIELEKGDYASAWINVGYARGAKSDHAGEMEAYRRAFEHHPNLAELESIADRLARLEAWSEARPVVQRCLELRPRSPGAHRRWGVILRHSGDRAGARAELCEAVRLDPDDSENHYELAVTCREDGDVDGATASLREAVRLRPDAMFYRRELALLYAARGREADAIVELREAVRLLPEMHDWGIALAWTLSMASDPELRNPAEAVEVARRSISYHADAPEYWMTLGVALYRLGDSRGAADALAHAGSLRSGADALDRLFLAMATERLGDHAAALDLYREALAPEAPRSCTPDEWARARREAAELIEPR